MKSNKGFTLIELMVVLILMTLVLTAIWQVYSSTRKNAANVMANNMLNDELDRTLIKITDDIREANALATDSPPLYELSEIANLTTNAPNNQLKFIKVNYDFSKDPGSLGPEEVNYTANQIRYYVEKENESDANSKWILNREMIPIDSEQQPIESEMTVYSILSGLDECVFYRIKDPKATRTGNIYIRLKMNSQMQDGRYSSESVISVKERGAMPVL